MLPSSVQSDLVTDLYKNMRSLFLFIYFLNVATSELVVRKEMQEMAELLASISIRKKSTLKKV